MGRVVALAVLCLGCRFDVEHLPGGAEVDGPPFAQVGDGPGASDGLTDAGVLIDLGAFGAPDEVDALSTSHGEDDPTLTADMLEIYFNTNQAGSTSTDIWMSTRASTADAWGPPVQVLTLSAGGNDTIPEVSPDGLTMFLARGGAGVLELYASTRASRADAWGTPQVVAELNSAWDDAGGSLTDDGRSVVFFSFRTGNFDVFVARRGSPSEAWSQPAAIAEVNSPTADVDPAINAPGTLLFFSSLRPGGEGSYDLFSARRADPAGAFEAPAPHPELNTGFSERDPWISPDGRVIYFESDRSGKSHIYWATR